MNKTRQLLRYILRISRTVVAISVLVLIAQPLIAGPNGPAPGKGPYMVFAHYMPNYPAYGYSATNNYWYNEPYAPAAGVRRGVTARPILHPTDAANVDVSAYVWDMQIAKQYGIDGFLVDELSDGDTGDGKRYRAVWRMLLQAAEIVGGFKIGLMPDYACLNAPTLRPQAREQIKNWVDIGMQSPAFLRYDGKPVVFPYGAGFPDGRFRETGESWPVGEKRDLVDWFAAQGEPIAYAPSIGLIHPVYKAPYANDPATGFQTYAFAAGSFTPVPADDIFQRALDYWPPSLMLMSENSFVYYNTGYKYTAGARDLSAAYRHRWEWTVAHRDRYRWIMLVTWNDWGETGIAPSVNHFMSWQPVTRYYADWFKTGNQPKIDRDLIEIFHRPHPFDAQPTQVSFRVQDMPKFQLDQPNDVVEALAFLTKPATLVIESGDKVYRKDVPAGVQSFVEPFALGVQSAHIERNGKTVASVVSPAPVTAHPGRQNLWFIGADSAHPPRTLVSTSWSGRGLSLFGDPLEIGDASISAKVTLKSGDAGVVLHSTDDGLSAIRLVMSSGAPAQWRLDKVVKGAAKMLACGTLAPGLSHLLRLDIVGEYHIAFIDGKLVAQVSDWPDWKDATQREYGKAGAWTSGDSADFSDIRVVSYDPPEPDNLRSK
ncbi:MAG: endo-1,3-alpha-glucanase family glycosylhydrolase [Capsulimonadaceae bacterium]|nr:endo-1,3-alpha-glucanase family glycosylhydrolase [Capsulimonadaceae bacterium]